MADTRNFELVFDVKRSKYMQQIYQKRETSYQKEEKLVPKTNQIGLDDPGPKGVGMQNVGRIKHYFCRKI